MINKVSQIRKVAILGSGVMGSQIAAHCVNAGLEVVLLDLKGKEENRPNQPVEDALKHISKMKPAPFALPEYVRRIKIGNFDDDLHLINDADWICEVIIERMDIKQSMMAKIESHRRADAIVSSNTSGLPITEICENCNTDFKKHFLGTHFFNPPRYMKLLELIPTVHTDKRITDLMKSFSEVVLGKGVVICKDTPNFIANRIGIFSIASIMPHFFSGKFRAEEIDLLTGTLTGYSKAATFRTADMAGLDVTGHVAKNLIPNIPDDERQDVFSLPAAFGKMIEAGAIGNKSGAGFYKKSRTPKGTEFLVLNPETMDYESQKKLEHPTISEALKIKNTGQRLKFIVEKDDEIGNFVWEVQRDLLLYAARRVPEITDEIIAIDRAMKWGFNWEMGPFERWDALGLDYIENRLETEGFDIPNLISDMKLKNYRSFYLNGDNYYSTSSKEYVELPSEAEGEITIAQLRKNSSPVFKTDSGSLHDLGDGVALFEFTTKKSTLGFELVETLEHSFDYVKKDFDALVLSHDGDQFAYGANLKEALEASKSGEWSRMEAAVNNFQRTALGLRYQPFPVVAAPFGMTLGGGCEFVLYSDKVMAHHELYMGLVEVGVGLIPAGGGTTELLKRLMNKLEGEADPLPFIRQAFSTVGMAKVSDSAASAKSLNLLRESDQIVMNRRLLIAKAKQAALQLVGSGYQPPAKSEVKVLGQKSLSALKLMLYMLHESNFIGDYGKTLGERIAYVMAGGDLSEPSLVSEDYLLKLEREAILECLRDERTLKMIEHTMNTGKPLRI